MNERIINLEVKDAGAWRRVTSFDLDTFEDGDLEHCAHELLSLSSNKNLSARLIMPGDTAPLLIWQSFKTGWREWRDRKVA